MGVTRFSCLSAVAATIGLLGASASDLAFAEDRADQPGKAAGAPLVRSVRSGNWSAPATWEGEKVPVAGDRVQIRTADTGRHVGQGWGHGGSSQVPVRRVNGRRPLPREFTATP